MIKLSVIVLSYNTSELTKKCLNSLTTSLARTDFQTEVIVIDNASSDDSPTMLNKWKKLSSDTIIPIIIRNKENVGYPKGNNQGLAFAKGEYVLLLNSDVIIDEVDFGKLIEYMEKNSDVGVLTVKVRLPAGGIDPASHRGFPTPWNAFCYYSKLEKLLGRIGTLGRIFGGYHLTHLDLSTIHEIDSPAGAFYLTRKNILTEVDGFDEQFFMYGEDIDLSFRIRKLGYKVIYYPIYTVTHYKHISGLKSQNESVKARVKSNFYEAMRIFYHKHYERLYPAWLTAVVYFVIDLKKKFS